MLNANPQQQQTTIDQLTDEQLAVHGWNQYRTLEGARRQAQQCEQNILAIGQELDARTRTRQEAAQKEEGTKRSEQDVMMAKIEKLLAGRSVPPPTNGTLASEAKEPKAE